jgi:hypothetical protein
LQELKPQDLEVIYKIKEVLPNITDKDLRDGLLRFGNTIVVQRLKKLHALYECASEIKKELPIDDEMLRTWFLGEYRDEQLDDKPLRALLEFGPDIMKAMPDLSANSLMLEIFDPKGHETLQALHQCIPEIKKAWPDIEDKGEGKGKMVMNIFPTRRRQYRKEAKEKQEMFRYYVEMENYSYAQKVIDLRVFLKRCSESIACSIL